MITDLAPDILECEVKWALESIAMNKASGGDGIPVKLFQILKDDAVASSVVLEKTLKSPLDCKKIQPVHPKGDPSWVLLEGLILKLKLQHFGHLIQRADSFEKTLMLGKIEGGRRRG